MTVANVLSTVGDVVTASIGWMSSFLGTITAENGLLAVPVVMSFALFGIHVLKSLMGR